MNSIHPILKFLCLLFVLNQIYNTSASAGANSLRIFSSDAPTYLLRTSGPFTISGSFAFNILPICRAIKVLPVPGGPYSKMPFTCCIPILSTISGGNIRETNARLKMLVNSSFLNTKIPNLILIIHQGRRCLNQQN